MPAVMQNTISNGDFGGNVPKANLPTDDSTQKFIARFNDPSQWRIVPGVPVFDAHEEQYVTSVPGPDGRPVKQSQVERFGQAELEEHAANCNRLVATGNPVGLTIGHTKDDGPESTQPVTVGYAKNYRVQYSQQLGRPVIVHDEYFDKDAFEKYQVDTYPFRSVERWRKGKYFKPVALLRREPRRNLGVVAYQSEGDLVIRYSMEYAMPEQRPDIAAPPAPAPAAAPAAAAPAPLEPSDKDRELFAKLCYAHPQLGAMMKKYEMESSAESPPSAAPPPAPPPAPPGQPEQMAQASGQKAMWGDVDFSEGKNKSGGYGKGDMKGSWHDPSNPARDAAGGAAAMPSGTNTAIPSLPKEKQPMSADTAAEVERYQKRIDDLERRDAQRDRRIAELEKGERVARYGAKVKYMAEVEGYNIDPAEELVRCQDYSQEEFDQHIGDIEKYGADNRKPLGGPLRIDGLPYPSVGKNGGQRRMTKEEYEKAQELVRDGVDTTKAMRYAMGEERQPIRN